MVRCLSLVLLFAFSSAALGALVPVPNDYWGSSSYANGGGTVHSGSAAGVCSSMKMTYEGFTSTWIAYEGWPYGACQVKDTNGRAVQDVPINANAPSCPANSTPAGSGSCTCNAGTFERDGQCLPPDLRSPEQICEDDALLWNSTLHTDRSMRVQGTYTEFADGGLVCEPSTNDGHTITAQCKHWFTADLGFKDDKGVDYANGFSVALTKGDPRAGGSLVCAGEKTQQKPPDDCKEGYKGQVNGKDVCVEAWTGKTNTTDWTRTRGTDGTSNTTESNVTCNGDQCTVKETNVTRDSNGNITSTTTTVIPGVNRQGYCEQFPESAICGRKDDKSGGDKGPANRGGSGGGSGIGGGDLESPGTPGAGAGVPVLWEKKYPAGVKGVWDARSADLKSSGLGTLASSLMPTVTDGGSPPSWQLDFDFGGVLSFGSFTLTPDPVVWTALRAFTIICALVLARRLVFGG